MHEASILQYTMTAAERTARANGLQRLTKIRLTHGRLRGIYEPAMHKLFAIMKNSGRGDLFAECRLELEEVPVEIGCPSCGRRPAPDPENLFPLVCPCCGSSEISVLRGNELLLSEIAGY